LRVACLGLLLGCVIWSRGRTTALLQDMAGLRLSKVSVEGAQYLEEREILQAAGLPMGESMLKLDIERTAGTLQGLAWVEKVFIERRLPSSVLISVRERTPVALVEKGAIFGLDAQGRLLPPSAALAGEDLPLISGLTFAPEAIGTTAAAQALRPALDLLEFLQKEDPDLAQNVSEVNLAEAGALRVTFIDGLEATFEPTVTQTEFRRMALVLGDLNLKGRRAGAMDFRFKDMVLVKVRN
jgi:cell division protein FtsQ